MDFSAIKTLIDQNIRTNNNEDITGSVLQNVLLGIIETLGDDAINNLITALGQEVTNRQNAVQGEADARSQADNTILGKIANILNGGYLYQGIAGVATNPGNPTVSCFYFAKGAGTYTNFRNGDNDPIVITDNGLYALTYEAVENEYWEYNKITDLDDGVFDISRYHASGGTLATYADLSAALGTNGANVPAAFRKGGMSVKFVHTSDNNYVQFRYMGTSITDADFTNVANWQGVDEEPTPASKHIVESGGVVDYVNDNLKRFGYLAAKKTYKSGDIVFTSDDIKDLRTIHCTLTGLSNAGAIGFFDSSDQRITWEGWGSSGLNATKTFSYTLTNEFSYAKVIWGALQIDNLTFYGSEYDTLIEQDNFICYATNPITFNGNEVTIGEGSLYFRKGNVLVYTYVVSQAITFTFSSNTNLCYNTKDGTLAQRDAKDYDIVLLRYNTIKNDFVDGLFIEYYNLQKFSEHKEYIDSKVKTAADKQKLSGNLAVAGNVYKSGDIVFTVNDVIKGSTILCSLEGITNSCSLSLFKNDDTRYDINGWNSGGAGQTKDVSFVIPNDFGYAKIEWGQLYINKLHADFASYQNIDNTYIVSRAPLTFTENSITIGIGNIYVKLGALILTIAHNTEETFTFTSAGSLWLDVNNGIFQLGGTVGHGFIDVLYYNNSGSNVGFYSGAFMDYYNRSVIEKNLTIFNKAGIFVRNMLVNSNTVIFTSNDVLVGSTIVGTISRTGTGTCAIAFFDAEDQRLSYVGWGSGQTGTEKDVNYTIPDGFSYAKTIWGSCMLDLKVKGTGNVELSVEDNWIVNPRMPITFNGNEATIGSGVAAFHKGVQKYSWNHASAETFTFPTNQLSRLVLDITTGTTRMIGSTNPASEHEIVLLSHNNTGSNIGFTDGLLYKWYQNQRLDVLEERTDTLPTFYKDDSYDAFERISEYKSGKNKVIFPIFTDIHAGSDNNEARQMLYLASLRNICFDFIANLGDLGLDVRYTNDGITGLKELLNLFADYQGVSECPVLFAVGNHETYINDSGYNLMILREYMQNPMIRKFSNIHIVDNRAYGYYDNDDKKIRVIFLDTNDNGLNFGFEGYQAEQLSWLSSTLSSSPSGYTVIILEHIFPDYHGRWKVNDGGELRDPTAADFTSRLVGHETFITMLEAYIARTSGTSSETGYTSVSWDFTSASAYLAGVFCGDSHFDYEVVENGLNLILTQGFGNVDESKPSWGRRNEFDHSSETLIDIVCIDTASKEFKIIRMGAGGSNADRSFTY